MRYYYDLIDEYYKFIQVEHKLATKEFYHAKQLWKEVRNKNRDLSYNEYVKFPEYVALQSAMQHRHKLATIRACLKKIISVLEEE